MSGIPEGTPESRITIHFQKKKNGGGEVKRVTLLPGGTAWVVFEDPEGWLKLLNLSVYKKEISWYKNWAILALLILNIKIKPLSIFKIFQSQLP